MCDCEEYLLLVIFVLFLWMLWFRGSQKVCNFISSVPNSISIWTAAEPVAHYHSMSERNQAMACFKPYIFFESYLTEFRTIL